MIPEYFDHKINKDKTITLYHGLRNDSLDHFIIKEKLTLHKSADAPKMLWFSSRKDDRTYTYHYKNILSIDVPISLFDDKHFSVANKCDVICYNDVELKKFKIKILKINGYDWEDCKERIYNNYQKKQQQKADDFLMKISDDYDSIFYLLKNWILMVEKYGFDYKKWNLNEWYYSKNLIL